MSVIQPKSASAYLSLLDEEDNSTRQYALSVLNETVDVFWAEISDYITKLELLVEDDQFPFRKLAALLLSKVFYYLNEFDEALNFAILAQDLFKLNDTTNHSEIIITQATSRYIKLRKFNGEKIDERLESLIDSLFEKCYKEKRYKQAIGVAVESNRLDVIERCISLGNKTSLIRYSMNIINNYQINTEFKEKALNSFVETYKKMQTIDYVAISQCLTYLNDSDKLAELLTNLLINSVKEEKRIQIAYQISLDIEASTTQEFKRSIIKLLFTKHKTQLENFHKETETIRQILEGTRPNEIILAFMSKNNRTDIRILNKIKHVLDSRSSVYHTALSFANCIMYCGTTSDQFLRNNLEWLARANNWARFYATAALGVIHKGNMENSMKILTPYLPNQNNPQSSNSAAYTEGGAFFALGLIHANKYDENIIRYLSENLRSSQNEMTIHGICLGIGAASMATNNEDIYELLKGVLFTDNTVSGEASGISMGLVKLGTLSTLAIDEMLEYSKDTEHEKIARGSSIGLAFVMYGCQERAMPYIDQMMSDNNPIVRYGAMYCLGMAYCGTDDNTCIEKLLHSAVSDTNDDVKRAAVINLGFVLFKNPKTVPRIVKLLSQSYNPNVRYGAALALGIACAGTGLNSAVEILEPMTRDSVDYVKQGALVSLAMILIQQTEELNPKVLTAKKIFNDILNDKREDTVARFGAVLAHGIINAGGRNATISLQSKLLGTTSMVSVVGLALFTQLWFWFPMTHFISLSFMPTTIACVTKDFVAPRLELETNCKASVYAYPKEIQETESKQTIHKLKKAVLSTTKTTNAEESKDDVMEIDNANDSIHEENNLLDNNEEPNTSTIPNMSRVLNQVLPFLVGIHEEMGTDKNRFEVMRDITKGGIIMLVDNEPNFGFDQVFPMKNQIQTNDEQKTNKTVTESSTIKDESEGDKPETFTYNFK